MEGEAIKGSSRSDLDILSMIKSDGINLLDQSDNAIN